MMLCYHGNIIFAARSGAREGVLMSEVSSGGIARWIVPILTVLTTSGVLAAACLVPSPDESDASAFLLMGLLFGGGFVLAVANVVQAVVMAVRTRPAPLAFFRGAMLLLKLGLVPFYLIGGVVVLFAGLMAIHPVLAATLPLITIAAPLVTFGWIVMACCSAWTFAYAVSAWRAGLLSTGACVASCVLSLFFVADVVCAIILFATGRTRERRLVAEAAGVAR